MAEVTIELDKENETNTPLTEIPEPQVILLAPPSAFLPLPGTPATPWERWLGSFELYLNSFGKANLLDSAKCVLLQHCLGKEGKRVYAKLLPGNTTYKTARAALTTYFSQHRDIQLMKTCTSVANTELIGKQMDHSSAPLVLQTLDGEDNAYWGQHFHGQRRSDRLKKRKHPIPNPPRLSGHIEDTYYYSNDGIGKYYYEEDKTKCDSDDYSVDSDQDDPKDEDFKMDGNDMDDVDGDELWCSSTTASSTTKGNLKKDKPFCCPDCTKSFGRNDHLHRHMRDKHGSVTYTCSKCKESVGSYKELKTHRKGHTKLLSCPVCIDRSFIKPSGLARHMRSHTKEKPFLCPVCGVLFSQGYHLKRHLRVLHGNDTFICSACGESVGSFKELQTHKKKHAYSFACPKCDQRFPLKSELLSHMQSHSDGLNEEDHLSKNKQCSNGLGTKTSVASDHTRDNEGGSDAPAAYGDDNEDNHVEAVEEMEPLVGDGIKHSGGVEDYHSEVKPAKMKARGLFCPICINKSFIGPAKLARHMRTHTKEKPFCCKICSKLFSEDYHLRRHLRAQHSEFICSKCGQLFGSVEELEKHESTHGSSQYPCPSCDRMFYREEALLRHSESHSHSDKQSHLDYAKWRQAFTDMVSFDVHIETNDVSNKIKCFECPYCLKAIAYQTTLCRHLAMHEKEMKGTCSKCEETFGSLEELRTHMESHKRSYSCATCGKQFKLENALKKHEQAHRDEHCYCTPCNKYFVKSTHFKEHMKCHVKRESKCPHCNGIFLKLTSFKIHLRSHVDERPYQCPCCIECFTAKSDFEKHRLKHKKFKRANPFSCTRCEYAFTTLSELKAHMEQHNEEPVLNCPHCGKLYLNKAKLERHMSVHTGERAHLCSICGHGFTGPNFLKLHMVVHTCEKAYKCTLCSKTFKTKSGLRMHSARHLAAPPSFSCSECGRSYGRMVELKMHQRYHTGDKAHKCTCCSKRFITHYKLKVHMRTHTGERPYACSHCGQTFTQVGDKNRHLNKCH